MHDARERALASLDGLSVGDAFGERYFGEVLDATRRIDARALAKAPWRWTDDTEMAVSIVAVLEQHGQVDQDALAAAFAKRFDPYRGYGRGAFEILDAVRYGADWRQKSRGVFGGRGSFGNGAAMRVAPLGAWFADDLPRCLIEAQRSAEITHAHEEGIAGAVAVAATAALLWQHREAPRAPDALLADVEGLLPPSHVREGVAEARKLGDANSVTAAATLGNGSGITAPDTVPFCLWTVAHYAGDYEEALWATVRALGDRDTTCAIVGGVLGAAGQTPPAEWLTRREPLPAIVAR